MENEDDDMPIFSQDIRNLDGTGTYPDVHSQNILDGRWFRRLVEIRLLY